MKSKPRDLDRMLFVAVLTALIALLSGCRDNCCQLSPKDEALLRAQAAAHLTQSYDVIPRVVASGAIKPGGFDYAPVAAYAGPMPPNIVEVQDEDAAVEKPEDRYQPGVVPVDNRHIWYSLRSAQEHMDASGKQGIVIVSKENCVYCDRLKADCLDELLATYGDRFVIVVCKPWEGFGVNKATSFPTTLICADSRTIKGKVVGYSSKKSYLSDLRSEIAKL